MPLLSVTDALLFFTLILNAIAIAKPRGGLKPPNRTDTAASAEGDDVAALGAHRSRHPHSTEDHLLAPGDAGDGRNDGGSLAERAGLILFNFRRCGVFIALWNVSLMVAMVTVLA